MRHKIAVIICAMMIFICAGCGAKTEDKLQATEQQTDNTAADEAQATEMDEVKNDLNEGDDVPDVSEYQADAEDEETESIQQELARIESESVEYENADWGSMGQQDMNQTTAEWYKLWDDELNSLWSRLSDELDAETKAKVLDEQRAWITRKEENVRGAGAYAYGGSLQAQLENTTAEEMTRARAYILAGYLADVRNESFAVSPEIQESISSADPSLDEVFEKFEGQWIFDKERGACVGVERTQKCAYGVEGSNWTVWVTGGDLFSDLDLYGYTERSIIFKTTHDGFDAFQILLLSESNSVVYEYGTSLAAMDDIIVCD